MTHGRLLLWFSVGTTVLERCETLTSQPSNSLASNPNSYTTTEGETTDSATDSEDSRSIKTPTFTLGVDQDSQSRDDKEPLESSDRSERAAVNNDNKNWTDVSS